MGTEKQTLIIEPAHGWGLLDVSEVWKHRELLYFLVWRDIQVRYKQTAIGAAWAILQPFLTMVVFSVLFGGLIQVSSEGVPYPIFAFTALLPWTLFTSALFRASTSLVNDANLISKIYFPRILLPLSAILSAVFDFAIAFVVLIGMMLFYRIMPGVSVLTLPFFFLLALATAFGCGMWLAALNVKYRDIGYVVPFLIQFWLFVTPVAYSSQIIPSAWRIGYGLNPMSGVVEGFRWALLGTASMPDQLILVSATVVVLLLVSGLLYFGRMEHEFADVV